MEILSITKSRLRRELLRYFFLHPGECFYLRELERTLCLSVGNIRRELKKLEQSGLFTSKKVGNLLYYLLNKKHPFYSELRVIILKTAGLGDIIKDIFKNVKGIKYAFIYGSFAKGEEISSSDVDLMVIGNAARAQLASKLYAIEKRIGRQVNLLSYSLKEWSDRIEKENAFVKNILKEKLIMLIGNEHELRRIKKR
jgi:predicted nucleotidyltransferase